VERKIEQAEKKVNEDVKTNAVTKSDLEAPLNMETQVAKGYVAAVRALLLEDGEPPLDLPGMLIYERAQAIQASLQRCLTKKRASSSSKSSQNFQ
jgi:hypothetical protein